METERKWNTGIQADKVGQGKDTILMYLLISERRIPVHPTTGAWYHHRRRPALHRRSSCHRERIEHQSASSRATHRALRLPRCWLRHVQCKYSLYVINNWFIILLHAYHSHNHPRQLSVRKNLDIASSCARVSLNPDTTKLQLFRRSVWCNYALISLPLHFFWLAIYIMNIPTWICVVFVL